MRSSTARLITDHGSLAQMSGERDREGSLATAAEQVEEMRGHGSHCSGAA